MKKRICNKCGREIQVAEDYHKVVLAKRSAVTVNRSLSHSGDLCEECWRVVDNESLKNKKKPVEEKGLDLDEAFKGMDDNIEGVL